MNYEEMTSEILDTLDELMDDYDLSVPVDASDELEQSLPTMLQNGGTTEAIVEEIQDQLRENSINLFDNSTRARTILAERLYDIIGA